METMARMISYLLIPAVLASAVILLDRSVRTSYQRSETVLIYWLAIAVGAAGLGGFFGHVFLSDLVAESIGWETGSPFQLEMGYANLAMGLLGIVAISQGRGFRLATAIAVTTISFGATIVHLQDIVATGNLAPGNTLQNVANVIRPVILILLLVWQRRVEAGGGAAKAATPAFRAWHQRQGSMAGLAAAGVGMGFGLGFMVSPLAAVLGAAAGALLGVAIGTLVNRRTLAQQATTGS